MKRLRGLDLAALILLMIGGFNWGMIGIFRWNFVEAIFGGFILTRITYIVVGLAALYVAARSPHLAHLRLRHVAKEHKPATTD